MKLRRIVLDGFKSFAERTVIEVADGITAIVGPNGSGKSNVLDGIRWLFGEHSLKNIRAEEKGDILFSGSDTHPPALRAFVELVIDIDGNETTVSKELTRDGKITYRMNGYPVRLKDIKELFAGTGVGRDFYSIIGQGQVEKIVSASGKELRRLFEEAAGTAYYREKKRETLVKLESVRRNLDRLNDVMFEMEKRMRSLYLKAKRAERYVEYNERLEEIRNIYYGNLAKRAREKREEIMDEMERSKDRIKEIQRRLVELESNLSTLKAEMESVDRELVDYTRLLSEYEERKRKLREVADSYRKRMASLEGELVEISTRIDSLEKEVERLEKRKEETAIIRSKLLEELENAGKELEELEKEYSEVSKDLSEMEKEVIELERNAEETRKNLTKLENEKERLTERIADNERRLRSIEGQIEMKKKRKEELEFDLRKRKERFEELSAREKKLVEEIERLNARREELRLEKEKMLEDINSMMKRKASVEAEISVIERQMEGYEGFSRAVREVFRVKDRFEGLYDVVANIIEMDREHEEAIGALLGGGIQNVVVRDANVGKEIIEYLRSIDGGRITLLPLDLIEGRVERVRGLEKHPGFIGYAVDLVRVPKGFEKLTAFLFGGDVVVETLDDAIDVKRKYKIRGRVATLKGDVIGTRGSMSGGGGFRKDPIIGRRNRLRELRSELETLNEDIEKIERDLKALNSEIEEVERLKEVVSSELVELSAKSASVRRFIEESIKSLEELGKEIEDLDRLRMDYSNRIKGMRERIGWIKLEEEALKKEIEKIENELKNKEVSVSERRKVLSALSEKIFEVRLKHGSLSEKFERYEEEFRSVQEEIEKRSAEREELLSKLSKIEREIENLREFLVENERELESLEREFDELFESMRLHHEDKEKKIRMLEELEKEMGSLKEERDGMREYLHRLEMDLQSVEFDLKRFTEVIGDVEVEIVPDEELERLRIEMEDLERKLKHLGPVDLSAIDEYWEVETEYSALMKQKKDLEEAEKKLVGIMEATEREARKRFMEVFEKVNENFSKLVEFLFFGGDGRIKMTSEDVFESDLEIVIRKPGRRSQKLQLLSGGEKALVAIALLFSFLRVNPSPFYILDEVDAPLDDYNAERFAQLVKESSKDAQFILITHNKIVMESADVLNGITMSNGVSLVIPVRMIPLTQA